jgi:hypothetical protein
MGNGVTVHCTIANIQITTENHFSALRLLLLHGCMQQADERLFKGK